MANGGGVVEAMTPTPPLLMPIFLSVPRSVPQCLHMDRKKPLPYIYRISTDQAFNELLHKHRHVSGAICLKTYLKSYTKALYLQVVYLSGVGRRKSNAPRGWLGRCSLFTRERDGCGCSDAY